jgi:murein DD-endopeptidase MepM/ murein hydrolase activator NlpD
MYTGSIYFNDNNNLPSSPDILIADLTCKHRFLICTHWKLLNLTAQNWFGILFLILFPLIIIDTVILISEIKVTPIYAADIDSHEQNLAQATASAVEVNNAQKELSPSSISLNATSAPSLPTAQPSKSPTSTPAPQVSAPIATPDPIESPQPTTPTPPPSNFHRPLETFKKLTSYFSSYHPAIDLSASSGTPVYAVLGGRVSHAGWSYDGYGKSIIIESDGNTYIRYAHLSQFDVVVGTEVTQGQTIGSVGCTGNCSGSHLHLQLFLNGKFANPLNFLKL